MRPMSIGHLRALRLLHRTFRNHPAGARLHILIRYFTAPFLRTLDLVPRDARILDIGAGHGTFARLALEAGAREVIAVEPDLRKSLLPLREKGIRVVAAFDDAIRGTFDAIAIYDATYRIPLPERHALYERVYERLKPGGLFILKDLDSGHRWKMKWARFQEWLSDHLLGVSMGSGFIYESNAEIEERMKQLGFEEFRARRIDFGYPHSHIVYTARKPVGGDQRVSGREPAAG
jgi:SAM-dependent methyltransferase